MVDLAVGGEEGEIGDSVGGGKGDSGVVVEGEVVDFGAKLGWEG